MSRKIEVTGEDGRAIDATLEEPEENLDSSGYRHIVPESNGEFVPGLRARLIDLDSTTDEVVNVRTVSSDGSALIIRPTWGIPPRKRRGGGLHKYGR